MANKDPFAGFAVDVEEDEDPFAGHAVDADVEEEVEGKREYAPQTRAAGMIYDAIGRGLAKVPDIPGQIFNLVGAGAQAFSNATGIQPIAPIPIAPSQSTLGKYMEDTFREKGVIGTPEFQPEGTAQEYIHKGIEGAASSPGGPLSLASGAMGAMGGKLGKDVAGDTGELVGGLTGAIAGGSLAKQTSKAFHTGETGKPVYDAMKEEGVKPRLVGDATTDKLHKPGALQQTTAFLGQVPILGRPISKAVDDTIEEVGRAKARLQQQIGPGTMDDVAFGQHVQQGLDDSLRNFRQTADTEYARLAGYTQPTDLFSMNNTIQTADRLLNKTSGAATSDLLSSPFIKNFKAAVSRDYAQGAPYGALENLRKEVGAMLSSRSGVADVHDGELKAMYGALSQDMREAARIKGFEHEFDTINNWYSTTRDRLNNQAKLLDGYAGQVYASATAGIKQGGERLQDLKDSLGPGNWNFVRSSVLQKMGMIPDAKNDVHFDVSKFFNDYKNISEDAKKVLFPEPDYRKSLDNLAVISEAMQTSAKAGNTSRSGVAVNVYESIGKFMLAVPALATGVATSGATAAAILPAAGQWGISKMLANPTLTKWLATPVKEFGGLDKAVYQLNKITAAQPELADDVLEFLEENRDALEQPSETERAFGGG